MYFSGSRTCSFVPAHDCSSTCVGVGNLDRRFISDRRRQTSVSLHATLAPGTSIKQLRSFTRVSVVHPLHASSCLAPASESWMYGCVTASNLRCNFSSASSAERFVAAAATSATVGSSGDGASSNSSSSSSSSSSNNSGSVGRNGHALSATWRGIATSATALGPLGRFRLFLFGNKRLDRQRIARYGLGAFAAYGVISNLNAGVLATLSWLTVVRQTGLTPLAPGQWQRFLGVYAGLWLASGFMRPIRLSMAIAAAPAFNAAIDTIERRGRLARPAAFGIMLAIIAVFSTAFMAMCILFAGGFSVKAAAAAA